MIFVFNYKEKQIMYVFKIFRHISVPAVIQIQIQFQIQIQNRLYFVKIHITCYET